MTPRAEHGSVTLESTVLAPVLLAILLMIAVAGRIAVAAQSLDAAASAGARAASIARSKTDASTAANSIVKTTLGNQGVSCTDFDVTNDLAGFAAPIGERATVTTTVTCRVSLADLTVAGVPGFVTLTATAWSPLDQFRERGRR
jgi:Flp pilus assembly protein TadG